MIHLDTSFLVDLLREQTAQKAGAASAWLSAHADQALGASVSSAASSNRAPRGRLTRNANAAACGS